MCNVVGSLIDEGAKKLGLSHEKFCEFLELFLEVSRGDIVTVRQAIRGGDRLGAANAAHSIKGAAISLDLTLIAEAAVIVEDCLRIGAFADALMKLKSIEATCDAVSGLLREQSAMACQSDEPADEPGVPIEGKRDGEL